MKRPAIQNKQVVVLEMAFRARKVLGTFEKRDPAPISALLKRVSMVNFFRFVCPIFNETKSFLTSLIHN